MSPQRGGVGPTAQLDEASSLRAYLSEIRRFPRLTAREEVELAQRIERNEPGARQQMITANLRLVVAVARRFADGRAPLLDLIQEGNTGLMRAVERFDWRHGFRFSSFAMQWVQQPIARAAAEADELRAEFRCADLERALATVEVRERTILGRGCGRGGGEPRGLVDGGNRLGRTAGRIRQLQAQALAKLRRTSAARILEGYAAG